jgi:uncharacterized protein (TIGR02145 family)
MKLRLLILLNLAVLTTAIAQKKFTITDKRDNRTYNAIEFSIELEGGVSITRAWLLENANFETPEGSFCYKDEPAYCDKFGRLYTFSAASLACPEGWRIPVRKDWIMLFSAFGGANSAGVATMAGGTSGMNFMLGGFGYGGDYYNKVGQEGNYWDAFDHGNVPDGVVTFSAGSNGIKFGEVGQKLVNSARCIQIHR